MDSKLYSKARLIVEASHELEGVDEDNYLFTRFTTINDLGIPLAKAITYGLVEDINEKGKDIINETWIDLCRLIMVDSDAEYEVLSDMLEIGAIDES